MICRLSTGALSRLIVSNRVLWKGVNNLRAGHVRFCNFDLHWPLIFVLYSPEGVSHALVEVASRKLVTT